MLESRSLIPFIKSLTHFDISQSFLELGHMATGLTFFHQLVRNYFYWKVMIFFFFLHNLIQRLGIFQIRTSCPDLKPKPVTSTKKTNKKTP